MDAPVLVLYNSNMPPDPVAGHIPSYNLYGEYGDLPDILHCESIGARAALHDWNIRPHRHRRVHQFLAIRAGGGSCEIDGRRARLDPPMILSIPPQTVHGFVFAPGTSGWVVTVPVEILPATAAAPGELARRLSAAGIAQADAALIALFDDVAREHGGMALGRADMLQAQAMVLAARIARRLGGENAETGGLFGRFELLIEDHFRDHWRVGDYAEKLAVSPTHLSRLTRAKTGMPASRMIEARLLREARRSLAYTNKTIREIAYELGFDDPAYFTRAFARATGRAPSAYRRSLGAG